MLPHFGSSLDVGLRAAMRKLAGKLLVNDLTTLRQSLGRQHRPRRIVASQSAQSSILRATLPAMPLR